MLRQIALIATSDPALEGDAEDGDAGLRSRPSGRFGDVAGAQRICRRGGQKRQFRRFPLLWRRRGGDDGLTPAAHFGWIGALFCLDAPASSELTRQAFAWKPTHVGLIDDLEQGHYFSGR